MANRYRGGGGVSLKPENSLKRAEELIGVGQVQNALQTLHDTITNKRHQRNWNKALEQVMLKHIDLCVETKSGRKCKDALINYRNTVQGMNVGSLELVVNHLIDTASARAEAARAAAAAALDDVADLEADASPEELQLSYVSGERSADRTDRELATPWFKFLWETLRAALDVLRNNARLEALYAAAAGRAFAFCRAHRRPTEFRRLCDILRNHLANLVKYRDQPQQHRTDLSNPASWELCLGMRFDQLRGACDLELWAEAFRTVEDIQGLLALAPRGAGRLRPAHAAAYYTRLTQVFTRSGAALYNAAAWNRLAACAGSLPSTVVASGEGAAPDAAEPTATVSTALAANVVLSALAVMPYEGVRAGSDGSFAGSLPSAVNPALEAERAAKMAAVLGFVPGVAARGAGAGAAPATLTRAGLLEDAARRGALAAAPAVVREVYAVLEGEADPLALCARLTPLLERLPGALGGAGAVELAGEPVDVGLAGYVPALQRVALARTVRQLGAVYSVMRVSTLTALAPFAAPGAAEALVVEGVRAGYYAARFDHLNGTVRFGGRELGAAGQRDHVAQLASRLATALASPAAAKAGLAPPADGDSSRTTQAARAAAARAAATAADANRVALSRKRLIERRKEEAEAAALSRERAAEEARAAAEAAAREAEERRKAADRAKREAERLARELEEREQEELKSFLASKGKRVGAGERLDAAAVTQEARSDAQKAAEAAARKLARVAKALDHTERARREEETPLLDDAWTKRATLEAELDAEAVVAAAAAHRAAWEADLVSKAALAALAADRAEFAGQVQARRAEEFAARLAAKKQAVEEARARRAADRALARRREYVRQACVEVEAKRKAEEEEAAALEAERRRREVVERQRRLDEIAEQQRRREAEIEAKRAAERAAYAQGPPAAAPRPAPTLASGGAAPAPAAAAAAAESTQSSYVPVHRRAGAAPAAAPAARPGPAPGTAFGAGGQAWRSSGNREQPPASGGDAKPEVKSSGAWVPSRRGTGAPSSAPPPQPRRAGDRW